MGSRQCRITLQLTMLIAAAGLLTVNVKAEEEELCLAKDDQRWDPKRNRCKKCPKCEFGKGRNFTSKVDIKRDEHGDLKCIRCTRCPKNTFDVTFNNDCQPCTFDRCAKEKKHVALECNILHDIKCGACLSGYSNPNGDGFPCIREIEEYKATTEHIRTERSTTDPPGGTYTNTRDWTINRQVPVKEVELAQQREKEHSDSIPAVFIIGVGAGVLVISALAIASCFIIRRRRNNHIQDNSSVTNSNAHDQDIEMDGSTQNLPKNLTHTYLQGELASHSRALLPHPELSREVGSSTTGPECGMPSSTYQCSRKKYNQVCRCDLSGQKPCHTCMRYTAIFDGIKVKKGDNFVTIVSKHICHDPVNLFYKLNIPDAQIYQIDDDRQRDPQRISQRECIQKTLNTHLEKREMDLAVLSRALCNCEYHHINEKIKQTLVIGPQDNNILESYV